MIPAPAEGELKDFVANLRLHDIADAGAMEFEWAIIVFATLQLPLRRLQSHHQSQCFLVEA